MAGLLPYAQPRRGAMSEQSWGARLRAPGPLSVALAIIAWVALLVSHRLHLASQTRTPLPVTDALGKRRWWCTCPTHLHCQVCA